MCLSACRWGTHFVLLEGPFSDSDVVGVFGSDSLVIEDWMPGFIIGPAQPGNRGLFVVTN